MKKFIAAFLIVVMTLGLSSCAGKKKLTKKNFVGRWSATAFFTEDENYPDDYDKQAKIYRQYTNDKPDEAKNYVSLNKDGSMMVCYGDSKIYGTWELKNNKIIFKDPDSERTLDEYRIDATNNRLILDLDDNTLFIYEKTQR